MKYRSRLTVDAWQVCFDQTAPDWVLEEMKAERVWLRGWDDGLRWYDVHCDQEDVVAYALRGDWIVRDELGNLSCLPHDIFQKLFIVFDEK